MNRFVSKALLAALIAIAPLGAFAQHGRGHDDDHGRKEEHHEKKKQEHREQPHQTPGYGHTIPPGIVHKKHVDQGLHLGWQKQAERDRARREAEWAREHRLSQEQLRRKQRFVPAQDLYHRRQETKNEWRNLAIASGLVGVIGLLEHDKTLTFAGSAGALYSLYRYEQDRKSQNNIARARAFYFSKPYFIRDGRRYDRRTVTSHGQRYYQFVRR